MLDIKFIIEHVDEIKEGLQKKGYSKEDLDIDALIALYKDITKLKTSSQALAEEKNKLSNSIKSASADERPAIIAKSKALGEELKTELDKLNAEQEKFKQLKADVAVVAAYGLLLPKEVITACKLGCLNVHASLLPRWRGAAPIQRAIEAGDTKSGVTIMQIVEALDAGAMYKKGEVEIISDTTGGILHDKLAEIGADLMSEVLADLDNIEPEPLDESLVTYAQKLSKEECKIDFNMSTEVLERKIRAFNPFPAMFFEYNGERFKVLRAKVCDEHGVAGTILQADNKLVIACADKALEVLEIQRQGKRPMFTEELLRGFKFETGTLPA